MLQKEETKQFGKNISLEKQKYYNSVPRATDLRAELFKETKSSIWPIYNTLAV